MKRLKIALLAVALMSSSALSARTWHISPSGSDSNSGEVNAPLRTISKAAAAAIANDTILIQSGVYRERVSPANPGLNEREMVTYMAAPGADVAIKGSEVVKGWKKVSKGVWRVSLSNVIFGAFNPFAVNLSGDWLHGGSQFHLGAVYSDDFALAEKLSVDEVKETEMSWVVAVDDEQTTITANFGKVDPNKSLTEVNARNACFAPRTTGINYIRVQGMKLSQAATQWAPPTAEQEGLIAPNWSKGWVIEDCEISHSKCVGISLGKDRASGQNRTTLYDKEEGYIICGFNREIEAIIAARELGWNRETVGSHKILNNKIYNCGQGGIIGHLGSAFSVIKGNEIHDINYIKGMKGFEIAGIKLHAAIDVVIEGNLLDNCYMGMWLDWQAQGTRIFNNVFAHNIEQDFFVEVSHGPTFVYNNIMLSHRAMHVDGQGLAIFNNLIWGRVKVRTSDFRYTPYHYAHSTKLRGLFNNTGGDARYYNNIFLANGVDTQGGHNGLEGYVNHPPYTKDWGKDVKGTPNFLIYKFPIWTGGNVYFGATSQPYAHEVDYSEFKDSEGDVELERRGDKYYLKCNIDQKLLKKAQAQARAINTKMLGRTTISELWFENNDGSCFVLDKDFYGNPRNVDSPKVGPFEGDCSEPIWQF